MNINLFIYLPICYNHCCSFAVKGIEALYVNMYAVNIVTV
jgi:hypothetical protein